MPINERLTLKIQSVAFGGHGVGRADGLVIFVPFTAPEDIVEIEIIERRKKFARGRLLKVMEPSRLRTQPLCRYYGRCGGCSYQHIDYASQLSIKQTQVQEAFVRIGGIAAPPVREMIGSPRPYAYRGKAELHAARTARGTKLGFMDISGGRITDIERCEIMDESINDQIRQARSLGHDLSARDDLIFWSGPSGRSEESVSRVVKEREFLVPRTGFFQANLYLTDTMVDEVARLMMEKTRETVMDACCGSGLFSILLAWGCRRMIGIEISEKSISHARANARRHQVQNVDFICGDIENVLKDWNRRKDGIDLMILDPPRTGLSPETLDAVGNMEAQDIIYISCNPATQARDVRFLIEKGYQLASVQPLDMFAQTEHIETIGLLRRRQDR